MDKIKSELEQWAIASVREELGMDCKYCLWERELEERWACFRAEQAREVTRECIRMADLESVMEERKGLRLFWLGVRLGLAMAGNSER